MDVIYSLCSSYRGNGDGRLGSAAPSAPIHLSCDTLCCGRDDDAYLHTLPRWE